MSDSDGSHALLSGQSAAHLSVDADELVDVELVEERGREPQTNPGLLPLDEHFPTAPVPWRNPLRFAWWLIRMVFAFASLFLVLAVVAAIPIVNFIALGYLLEVEGRMARTGRFLNSFPYLNQAPRLGAIALGVWVFLLPLRLLGSWAADAHL
ncbi:MAG: hypothetical protein KDA58_10270, partial [Planctomycetaceae bacterium]|nr:hypothetical protein [Planctomycetaceae bacterium]